MNGRDKNVVTINSKSLDDGMWHTVDVLQVGRVSGYCREEEGDDVLQKVEMVVDGCESIASDGEESCRAVITTRDDDERLNVVAPLQVGRLSLSFLCSSSSFAAWWSVSRGFSVLPSLSRFSE